MFLLEYEEGRVLKYNLTLNKAYLKVQFDDDYMKPLPSSYESRNTCRRSGTEGRYTMRYSSHVVGELAGF